MVCECMGRVQSAWNPGGGKTKEGQLKTMKASKRSKYEGNGKWCREGNLNDGHE
jgi:hypothetical protein